MRFDKLKKAALVAILVVGGAGATWAVTNASAISPTEQAAVGQSFQSEADKYRQAADEARKMANPPEKAPSLVLTADAKLQYQKVAELEDQLAANAQKLADFHKALSAQRQRELSATPAR
jgi:hypothetical protein